MRINVMSMYVYMFFEVVWRYIHDETKRNRSASRERDECEKVYYKKDCFNKFRLFFFVWKRNHKKMWLHWS